jgi:hypothetical protein
VFRRKLAPDLIGGGYRFADENMRQMKNREVAACDDIARYTRPEHWCSVVAQSPDPEKSCEPKSFHWETP